MEKKRDIRSLASQRMTERLVWFTAVKDQVGITRDMADEKDVQEIYGLGEAALFDEFFSFLDEFEVSKHFDELEPHSRKRDSNVSFPAVLLIYVLRIVCGLPFFWHIQPVILQSQSLMRLVGFNGRQVREGTSKRGVPQGDHTSEQAPCGDAAQGEHERSGTGPEFSGESEGPDVKVRGPFCPQSIGKYVEACVAPALERFFNGIVKLLADASFFPKSVHALLDASEIQSTQACEGCGKVRKEKAPALRLRKGRIRKVMETVFGFKLWVVWDANSKLPMAIRFTTIEVADVRMAQEVIRQAMTNLGEHARIVSVAMDRGFLDGKLLWWLDENHITFYVPAKTNMNVYTDALSLVGTGERQVRERRRSIGHGKQRREVIDFWAVEGLSELTSAGFYGELGSGSHENSKAFQANPINAVVVLDDPFKKNNPASDTLVLLTNGPVKKPLVSYDAYDERSEIENGMFREGKQSWFLQRPARNTASAFRAHVYLTMATIALTTAFRSWMLVQEKLFSRGKETGIRKFREKIRTENCNKFIVFDEDRYAIFEAYEIVILCGRNVLKPRGVPERITKEDILQKYQKLQE